MITYMCIVLCLIAKVQGDEDCGGLLTFRKATCSPEVILTIPSDGSGVYNLVLNTSMPIYSRENINVKLENKEAVQRGTADNLIYVVSHPSCDGWPRITRLVVNDRLLCENPPHKVTTKQAATKFSYESTHYGEKKKQVQVQGQSQYQPLQFGTFGTVPNNKPFELQLWDNILPASRFGEAQTTQNKNQINLNQVFGQGQSGAFPNNPFLSSLSAPSTVSSQPVTPSTTPSSAPSLFLQIGSVPNLDNRAMFNKNPFLNGQFAPSIGTATPTLPPLVNIDAICGQSTVALVQGGSDVQPGEFPWLGGLFTRKRNTYLCTINLVSQNHAITAAHCFLTPNDADIYGVLWGHPNRGRGGTFARIRSIQIHPGYNKTTLHDVAVVTLVETVAFSSALKPICTWKSGRGEGEGPGVKGVVAGFGPDYTDLKKVDFPIVTQEVCRGSNAFFHYTTSEFTFCAGTKKTDEGPCKGDSGAGYMQWLDDRYYLRGLVSHSLNANGNCNLKEYIIFADLSKEMNWIRNTIR